MVFVHLDAPRRSDGTIAGFSPPAVIEQPSVGGRIILSLEPKDLSCIIFTERWLFWRSDRAA